MRFVERLKWKMLETQSYFRIICSVDLETRLGRVLSLKEP